MPRWDRNGADAATIVKEYRAGRCRRGRFQDFIRGRQEWIGPGRYNAETLKRQYRNTIDRYERWVAGGTCTQYFGCQCKIRHLTHVLSEEQYPESFLRLCGLELPARNTDRVAGQDIAPGSDSSSEEEDPEEILRELNNLRIESPPAAPAPSDVAQPSTPTPPTAPRARAQEESGFVPLLGGLYMRIIDFIQPGRTIGTGEHSETRDMVSVMLSLPGGVQINTLDVSVASSLSVKWSWDYHPANFLANLIAQTSLSNDQAYLHAMQQKLNKSWKELADKNGRLGDSCEYKLTSLPEGKRISQVEGFVSPFTFRSPYKDDPCNVKRLTFNALDNTSSSVNIIVYLLVEKEQTQSVRRNRHRQVEDVAPEIESLPTELLPEIAQLVAAAPGSVAGQLASSNQPTGTTTTGSTTSNPRRPPPNASNVATRRVSRRSGNRNSPRGNRAVGFDTGVATSSTQGQASAATRTPATTRPRGPQPTVIQDDTTNMPTLHDLQGIGITNTGQSPGPAGGYVDPLATPAVEDDSPLSLSQAFFDAANQFSFDDY